MIPKLIEFTGEQDKTRYCLYIDGNKVLLPETDYRMLLSLAVVWQKDKNAYLHSDYLCGEYTSRYKQRMINNIKKQIPNYSYVLVINNRNGGNKLSAESVVINAEAVCYDDYRFQKVRMLEKVGER